MRPLFRHDMQQDRPLLLAEVLERVDEHRDAVAVHRAEVVEPQLGEDVAADGRLQELARPGERLLHGRTHHGDPVEDPPDVLRQLLVEGGHPDPVQVVRQRPHRGRDGHCVVVEDDEEVLLQGPRVIERLQRLPAGQRPVAHDRHHPALRPRDLIAAGDAQRGRERRPRVARGERVEGALVPVGEAGQPPELPEGREPVTSAGQQLVRVALVADVEDQAVLIEVEEVVEGDGQLDNADVRAPVAAVGLDDPLDLLAHLPGEQGKLLKGKLAQIAVVLDPVEKPCHRQVSPLPCRSTV